MKKGESVRKSCHWCQYDIVGDGKYSCDTYPNLKKILENPKHEYDAYSSHMMHIFLAIFISLSWSNNAWSKDAYDAYNDAWSNNALWWMKENFPWNPVRHITLDKP